TSDSFDERVTIKTATESEMLPAMSISRRGVGKGIRSVARIVTMPTARIMLLCDPKGTLGEAIAALLDLLGTAIMAISPRKRLV
ncbi:unnamed protein product, partial [marine sediment metagenome]